MLKHFGAAVSAVLFFVWAHPAQAQDTWACLMTADPIEGFVGFHDTKQDPSVEAGKGFDARGAEFVNPGDFTHGTVSIEGNGDATDMCWAGGFFWNSTDWHALDISWQESKDGFEAGGRNTSQINAREPRVTVTGVHAWNVHDGIKVKHSQDWLVQHCWVDYARDDAIESDDNRPGTLYDCLIDGAYTGFSSKGGSERPDSVVTFDRVLMRMEPMPYPYKWDEKDDPVVFVDGYGDVPFGHGSAFKLDEDSPQFDVRNSIFLWEYDADETVFPPPEKVVGCENNTIIWLDGEATAPTYLLDDFPGCFTIITDFQEGLNVWAAAVVDWHERHPEVGLDRKPIEPACYSWPRYGDNPVVRCGDGSEPPPDPEPEPDPDPVPEPDPDPEPDPEPVDACDGLPDGVHFSDSTTNEGRTWTAIAEALNCAGGDVVPFPDGGAWNPDYGAGGECVGWETGECRAEQPGIHKKNKSVSFFIGGDFIEVRR